MTCVGMCRPFPAWELLNDYKYRCIENGMDIESFHCYADRKHVRTTVFRKWERGDCSWYDRIKPAVNGEFNAVPKK